MRRSYPSTVAARAAALPGSVALVLALAIALALPGHATAQRTLMFAPTYQQSFTSWESRTTDPVVGQQDFHAWGFMVGLERPGRFWQPHLWYQRYEYGQPCTTPTPAFDCEIDGWALSVGPGFEVVRTPTVRAMILPQAGIQGASRDFMGGVGVHLGVDVGVLRPSGFARYQVIRGVHYGALGVGLILRLRLDGR